jgi:hypothetical protein
MLFTVCSTGGFYRKPYHFSGFKTLYEKIRETKKLESIYQCCGSGMFFRISDPKVSGLSKETLTKTVVQEFRLRALRKDVEEGNK